MTRGYYKLQINLMLYLKSNIKFYANMYLTFKAVVRAWGLKSQRKDSNPSSMMFTAL